jgi:hypothetical protein
MSCPNGQTQDVVRTLAMAPWGTRMGSPATWGCQVLPADRPMTVRITRCKTAAEGPSSFDTMSVVAHDAWLGVSLRTVASGIAIMSAVWPRSTARETLEGSNKVLWPPVSFPVCFQRSEPTPVPSLHHSMTSRRRVPAATQGWSHGVPNNSYGPSIVYPRAWNACMHLGDHLRNS